MSFKLHLICMKTEGNFPDISYLSETQKNNFQFLRHNNAIVTVFGY